MKRKARIKAKKNADKIATSDIFLAVCRKKCKVYKMRTSVLCKYTKRHLNPPKNGYIIDKLNVLLYNLDGYINSILPKKQLKRRKQQ